MKMLAHLNKNNGGFHLLELVIVLSIIAVLLAITVPHYFSHFTQARRLSAEVALMRLAGQMESFYAEHKTYEGATLATLDTPETLAQNNYRLAIQSQSAQAYQVAAIPQNEQAKNDLLCGTLTLNSKGVKEVHGDGSLNQCW